MNFNKKNILLTIPLSAILLTGCVSTAPKSDYTAFAQAGTLYASAIDKLLNLAGGAQVESTSWGLVMEKNTTGMDLKTYDLRTKEDIKRLEQISKLRSHAKLLAQYFSQLESLATSDAPEKTKTSIEGVVSNLGKLNLPLPNGVPALPAFGKFMVDSKIRVALKNELEIRKDLIRNELYIQEQLLEALRKDISHALTLEKGTKEQTLVIDPILSTSPLKDPGNWVATRRDVVYMPITVGELSSAQNAAKKMRETFETLLSGGDPKSQINTLLNDIDSILSIIETVKS